MFRTCAQELGMTGGPHERQKQIHTETPSATRTATSALAPMTCYKDDDEAGEAAQGVSLTV